MSQSYLTNAIDLTGKGTVTATAYVYNANSEYNRVTVCTVADNATRLPSNMPSGKVFKIRNDSATSAPLQIFPMTGGTMNALAADVAYSLPAGNCVSIIISGALSAYNLEIKTVY